MKILRATYLGIAAVALMGCSVGEDVAREQARAAIDEIVARQSPNIPVEPITDCIIDNASLQELLGISTAAGVGNNGKATEIVVDIVQRPETLNCIASKGLPFILNGVV